MGLCSGSCLLSSWLFQALQGSSCDHVRRPIMYDGRLKSLPAGCVEVAVSHGNSKRSTQWGQRTRRGESHPGVARYIHTGPSLNRCSTQVAAAVHKHRATPTTRQAFKSKAVSVPAVGGQPLQHTHLTKRGPRCTEACEQSCAADTGENWRVGIGCAQVTRPGSETKSKQLDSVR